MNALGENPIDFWGGTSSFFYSHIPNLYPGWESNLLLLQLSLCFVALVTLTFHFIKDFSSISALSFITFSYFALAMSSSLTRDGMMFSLMLLGFVLIFRFTESKRKDYCSKLKIAGVIILILAASFRPWIAPAISVLTFGILITGKNFTTRVMKFGLSFVIFIGISIAPFLIDQSLSKVMNLDKSYPQQQVFLMDFAATSCWSTNNDSAIKAKNSISVYFQGNKTPENLCDFFRPNTWESLIRNHGGMSNSLSLLTSRESNTYLTTQNEWIDSILRDPSSYIQNHFMFASQVLLAADTRGLRVLKPEFLNNQARPIVLSLISAIVFIPWDFAITFHLISILGVLFLWFFIIILGLGRYKKVNSEILWISLTFLIFELSWFALTSIAYIGDNGRYTYPANLTFLLSIIILAVKTNIQLSEDQIDSRPVQ
jgi:hypothetical protein